VQITDAEFRAVLAAAYGSADAPGRVIAQGAAADRLELQVRLESLCAGGWVGWWRWRLVCACLFSTAIP
jgi:hypothetical protein